MNLFNFPEIKKLYKKLIRLDDKKEYQRAIEVLKAIETIIEANKNLFDRNDRIIAECIIEAKKIEIGLKKSSSNSVGATEDLEKKYYEYKTRLKKLEKKLGKIEEHESIIECVELLNKQFAVTAELISDQYYESSDYEHLPQDIQDSYLVKARDWMLEAKLMSNNNLSVIQAIGLLNILDQCIQRINIEENLKLLKENLIDIETISEDGFKFEALTYHYIALDKSNARESDKLRVASQLLDIYPNLSVDKQAIFKTSYDSITSSHPGLLFAESDDSTEDDMEVDDNNDMMEPLEEELIESDSKEEKDSWLEAYLSTEEIYSAFKLGSLLENLKLNYLGQHIDLNKLKTFLNHFEKLLHYKDEIHDEIVADLFHHALDKFKAIIDETQIDNANIEESEDKLNDYRLLYASIYELYINYFKRLDNRFYDIDASLENIQENVEKAKLIKKITALFDKYNNILAQQEEPGQERFLFRKSFINELKLMKTLAMKFSEDLAVNLQIKIDRILELREEFRNQASSSDVPSKKRKERSKQVSFSDESTRPVKRLKPCLKVSANSQLQPRIGFFTEAMQEEEKDQSVKYFLNTIDRLIDNGAGMNANFAAWALKLLADAVYQSKTTIHHHPKVILVYELMIVANSFQPSAPNIKDLLNRDIQKLYGDNKRMIDSSLAYNRESSTHRKQLAKRTERHNIKSIFRIQLERLVFQIEVLDATNMKNLISNIQSIHQKWFEKAEASPYIKSDSSAKIAPENGPVASYSSAI
jgi:hypothetical protein